MSSFAAGILAAVTGAACYGAAPVVQAIAAREAERGHGMGMRLTARLARRPIWLLGLVLDIGGFTLEAYAFSAAPATFVAPVFACDTVFFLMLARLLLAEPLSRPALSGIATVAVGAGVLGTSFGGHEQLGDPASDLQLLVMLAGAFVASGGLVLLANRADRAGRPADAAIAFSVASGAAYGIATMATRQVGRTFSADQPWHLLVTPTPYVLAAASILAISLTQRGLQASAVFTFPIVSAMSSFVPVTLGAALLHDPVPAGAARAGFVVALVLIAAGLVQLGRARQAVEHPDAAPSPPGLPSGSADPDRLGE